ncbi:hypothetical protein HIM_00950 [Hirsutella minnesotensis 3608]|nr:hypothetical protein HIM_00950 [Hirsutella minnesotensis 3608]
MPPALDRSGLTSFERRMLFFDDAIRSLHEAGVALLEDTEVMDVDEGPKPSPFSSLPAEITDDILSYLPQPSLKACRLVDRKFESIASRHAFRTLDITGKADQWPRIIEIAKSRKLRAHVRSVHCYPSVGLECYLDVDEGDRPLKLTHFIQTMSCLRFFKGLKTVKVWFESEIYLPIAGTPDLEIPTYRYVFLENLFQCLAGTWTPESLIEMDYFPFLFADTADEGVVRYLPHEVKQRPLPIDNLVFKNMADHDEKRLTKDSQAFRRVINSEAIKNFSIDFDIMDEFVEATVFDGNEHPEKFELFRSLPRTWLPPNMADNLRELSLGASDYWGFTSPVVFQENWASLNFPRLEALTLHRFAFSQPWQIDWIASIGKGNVNGGLRELYIDDCMIVYYAKFYRPWGYPIDTAAHSELTDLVTQDMYPLEEHTATKVSSLEDPRPLEWTCLRYPLRWHHMLSRWENEMSGLRIISIGPKGSWPGFFRRQGNYIRYKPKRTYEEHHTRGEPTWVEQYCSGSATPAAAVISRDAEAWKSLQDTLRKRRRLEDWRARYYE